MEARLTTAAGEKSEPSPKSKTESSISESMLGAFCEVDEIKQVGGNQSQNTSRSYSIGGETHAEDVRVSREAWGVE